VTLVITSVTYRSCINRIACNSHSDNKNPISGTHVDNKMCRRHPLHINTADRPAIGKTAQPGAWHAAWGWWESRSLLLAGFH
jgi:hypothetical protein